MNVLVQLLLCFFVPFIVVRFRTLKVVKLSGTVGVTYALGLLCSAVLTVLRKSGFDFYFIADIGDILSHVAIGIAIPLLLFSNNIKNTLRLSKTAIVSFLSLVVSAIVISISVFFLYGKKLEWGAQMCSMAVGLYTGGTPNLNAIGSILKVDSNTIAVANLSDIVVGGIFYVFLLLVSKPLLRGFLGERKESYVEKNCEVMNSDDISETFSFRSKGLLMAVFTSVFMAVVCAGIGFAIWFFNGSIEGRMTDYLVPSLMIGVTILGIAGSFSKKLSCVKGTNTVGQYLILVFSFSLTSSINWERLSGSFLRVLTLYLLITVGTFILHIVLSKILHTDVDCAIITATAGIYGPAFVPAVARQIENEDVLPVGLICGSLGYSIGTFLGCFIAFILI